MIKIPLQLRETVFRFIKIEGGGKRPTEQGWTKKANYSFQDAKFKKYLKTATAYGIMAGGNSGLVILDIEKEHEELMKKIEKKLPKTFTVESPSGGRHYYFICKAFKEKIVLIKNKIHYGEAQWEGFQCLGPGSKTYSGFYKIIKDNEIAEISTVHIINVIAPYFEVQEEPKWVYNTDTKGKRQNWDMLKLADKLDKKYGLRDTHNDGILRGPHPVHGSTLGKNFDVNLEEGVWHCFRCGTGGDTLSLVALLEGLIECHECLPGVFRKPKLYTDTIEAGKKYGFEDKSDYKPPKRKDFNIDVYKGKLDIVQTTEVLKKLQKFIVVRNPGEERPYILVYRDGYYQMNGKDILMHEIKKLYKNTWDAVVGQAKMEELVKYMLTELDLIVDREEIYPPSHLINLNNGIYNLNTQKLQKHNSKYYFLYKIPWDYDPNAKCPAVMKYMKSTLKPQYIELSQELFGYTLLFEYPVAAIFYLYGVGGNGKSVWEDVLRNMLGRRNVSNKSINSLLTNRFMTAQLYGKLANICGEMSGRILQDNDVLKAASGGDPIQAEFKGKDSFDFYNRAKIITACNVIPYFQHPTDAWFERQYVIPFLKKFRKTREEIPLPILTAQLTTAPEMQGVLLWAIKGLQRLKRHKFQFTYPEDQEKRYEMCQRNMWYFVEKHYEVTINMGDTLQIDEIQREYTDWCIKNEIPIDHYKRLPRILQKAGFERGDRIAKGRDWVYFYKYIKRAF